ncbi:type IV conjugative transfer system protein TraE [Sulfuricystis multivorans]|uniref:type IV conjugative transfer system protein TraE n=1 Tax=Sulfuricystis multivorans TaxID=2211108 RepID=UPI000F82CF43|nr:type IV conjugative transfer system protein TraE [Sulfuricystis multivorans]
MLLRKLMADVEARAGVTKAFQMILIASLLTNVFMAGAFFTMDRTVRTILVPPEINKTFWVDGKHIGPEWLEQMGSWVISQYATVSPQSIDYQNSVLLKLVHPSVNGELAVRFKMGANRLKQENMSKIFMPREVRISEKDQAVALIGTQSTFIADKRVPGDEVKAYLVVFDYDGSRTFIKELRETSPVRPFDPPNAPPTAETESLYQQPAQDVPAVQQQAGTFHSPATPAPTAPVTPAATPAAPISR